MVVEFEERQKDKAKGKGIESQKENLNLSHQTLQLPHILVNPDYCRIKIQRREVNNKRF